MNAFLICLERVGGVIERSPDKMLGRTAERRSRHDIGDTTPYKEDGIRPSDAEILVPPPRELRAETFGFWYISIRMKFSILALGVIWSVFVVVWVIGMLTAKRTLRRNWRGGVWWRVATLAVIILLIHYHIVSGQSYLSGVVRNEALSLAGVVMAALGVALAVWARFHLGRNWGMPLSVKANPELVMTGPYACIRHPIYTGMLLALLGSTLVVWWCVVIFFGALIYFAYALRGEEELMQKEFPDKYPAYKARTWRLIPWIY